MTDGCSHLEVIQGEDQGSVLSLDPGGARIGRSSKNDIVLADPLLSRHHCRAYFNGDGALCLADLGSANQTIVNGSSIQDVRLHVGDRISLGDTVIRVINDRVGPPAGAEASGAAAAAAVREEPVVDIELFGEKDKSPARALNRAPLILVGIIVVAITLLVWIPKLLKHSESDDGPSASNTATAPAPVPTMHLDYEKVEADRSNIFRYRLLITTDDKVSVEMDDLANNRHVSETKQLDRRQVEALTRRIVTGGFFKLDNEYRGVEPDILHQLDLSVTVGTKTHRSRVVNRVPPPIFKQIQEIVETFGKTELHQWAMQFTAEKLQEMAREAYLLAKKLYDEREVKYGNLAAALRSFREAEFNLSSIDKKPDYYSDVVSSIAVCQDELQKRYDEFNFRAVRAMNNHQWEEAAHELRIICDMIPDRDDERNQKARNRLIEVEGRLKLQR